MKGMNLIGKPLPDLLDHAYLEKTKAFNNAFLFLKQSDRVNLVPTVEINGKIFLGEIPDKEFISKELKQLRVGT